MLESSAIAYDIGSNKLAYTVAYTIQWQVCVVVLIGDIGGQHVMPRCWQKSIWSRRRVE